VGEVPTFEVRESLAVLYRARKLMALFVVSALTTSLVLTYVYSERYRATTSIVYRPNTDFRFEGFAAQQRTMGFPVPITQPFEALGLTVRQVGLSERVLRPVVVALNLDKPEPITSTGLTRLYQETKKEVKKASRKVWEVLKHGRTIEGNPVTEAVEELAKNTTIDTRQKNYAATLTVVDKDPVRAAEIVDRIGAELIKFLQEQSVGAAREQGSELDVRLVQKKAEIDNARAAIQSLKTSNKFIELAEETSLHLRTAEQIEQRLLANQAELSAARAKLKALSSQVQALEPMVKGSETVADDPVYSHLRELKAGYEVELRGLSERLPPEHPDVRSVQAKIRTTEELLTASRPTRVAQMSSELSKVYQSIQTDEAQVKAQIAGLESAQSSMLTSLEKARARIAGPGVESKHHDLQLQLALLESDYKKLTTLREEIRAAELTTKAEVYALHPATPQDAPFRPIKIYNVALSGLLALIIGLLVTYLLDYGRWLMGNEKAGDEHGYA
jgi:uncharacterized protein involved in exopolysaccharide biosynthesis